MVRQGLAIEIAIEADAAALAHASAAFIAREIAASPSLAILVATGGSPMATYAELAAMRARGELDASGIRAIQLDEYLDLSPGDPRSLAGWMERSFVAPLGIARERSIRLEVSGDAEAGCRAFDAAVEAGGGIDLAILGLGPNGHLGFNEPPSDVDAPTRVVALTPESIVSNAVYWGEGNVPLRAATAGMRLIMAARRVLLIVTGERKRAILQRTLAEPPTPHLPSSLLRLREGVTVMCDRDAIGEH
jgi:glucosamine-6-phosphate deaminase